MPYSEKFLKQYDVRDLKYIFNTISAHKSALTEKPSNNKAHVTKREENIQEEGRNDLLLDEEQYKKKLKTEDKKAYLRSKILEIQKAPFLKGSKYADKFKKKQPDYFKDFGDIVSKQNTIDSKSGYYDEQSEQQSEEAVEKKPESEEAVETPLAIEIEKYKNKNKKQPKKNKQSKKEEPIKEEIAKEEVKPKPKPKTEEEQKEEKRERRFKDELFQFEDMMDQLSRLGPKDEYFRTEIHKELINAVGGMTQYVNRKDKAQVDMVKDKMREYSAVIRKTISREQPLNIAKEGIPYIEDFGDKKAAKELKELQQYAEDMERIKNTPEISFESTQKTSVSQNAVEASFKTLSGDQDIGNVRAIGFIAPSQAAAREEEVIPPPSERAKSLRRFVNFRWVYSTQNSSLGYDSPFQKIEDQENRRKFNYCYLPTNKLPKPETQEDLDKAKSFNTYPLVPQQSLVGMMQPASELSFKTSTNPNARKITIDEKQFADTKLYNFEPTQVNIKPTNPFSSMYGMEAIDQIKRNPNNVKNTLEFSSVMYDDCPIERIKRKYNKNVVA